MSDFIYEKFYQLLQIPEESICQIGFTHLIPQFDESYIQQICMKAREHFHLQPSLLRLSGQVSVIGDLHGNLHDLLRHIAEHGMPPNTTYLFLGDYIDRGPFSVEVILYLFSFALRYPNHVYLLRGNHEFDEVNAVHGFQEDLFKMFGHQIVYSLFNSVFSELPVAAIICDTILCLHGGIGPKFQTIQQIETLPKGIKTYRGSILEEIMWSDPSPRVQLWADSTRGLGCEFGQEATRLFLKKNNLKLIIRSHQCIQTGATFMCGKVLTIFSTSGYNSKSIGASLIILSDNDFKIVYLLPLDIKITRTEALFFFYRAPSIPSSVSEKLTPLSFWARDKITQKMARNQVCKSLILGKAHRRFLSSRSPPRVSGC